MTDLELALALADVADAITRDRYRAADLEHHAKADHTPVTEADTATEQAMRSLLRAERPDDGIYGEEFGGQDSAARGRTWILDPIDGTANYLRGVPVWASLIGLAVDGRVAAGVVSAPALGRRWYAATGTGAYLVEDGYAPRRIHVSQVAGLADAYLSYNGHTYWDDADRAGALHALIGKTGRNRAFGDFWGYMLVAEGAIDLAGEWGVAPYDLAALDVIVREAGGRFGPLTGGDGIWGGSAIATNGLVHDQAVAVIRGA